MPLTPFQRDICPLTWKEQLFLQKTKCPIAYLARYVFIGKLTISPIGPIRLIGPISIIPWKVLEPA